MYNAATNQYDLTFEDVLSEKRYNVSSRGTSLCSAALSALKELVNLYPKCAFKLVTFSRRDRDFQQFMDQFDNTYTHRMYDLSSLSQQAKASLYNQQLANNNATNRSRSEF